jgi:hypothetical protein
MLRRTERHVRERAGPRRYAFAERLDTPDQFVLVSEWDTHEAMTSYHRSEEFARYRDLEVLRGQLGALLRVGLAAVDHRCASSRSARSGHGPAAGMTFQIRAWRVASEAAPRPAGRQ